MLALPRQTVQRAEVYIRHAHDNQQHSSVTACMMPSGFFCMIMRCSIICAHVRPCTRLEASSRQVLIVGYGQHQEFITQQLHLLRHPAHSCSLLLGLTVKEGKVWNASDTVLRYLRCPLGVVNVQHHKIDILPEVLLKLQKA